MSDQDDRSFKTAAVLDRVGNFGAYLGPAFEETEAFFALRLGETAGRSAAERDWVLNLEEQIGRNLLPQKTGPKRKEFRD